MYQDPSRIKQQLPMSRERYLFPKYHWAESLFRHPEREKLESRSREDVLTSNHPWLFPR